MNGEPLVNVMVTPVFVANNTMRSPRFMWRDGGTAVQFPPAQRYFTVLILISLAPCSATPESLSVFFFATLFFFAAFLGVFFAVAITTNLHWFSLTLVFANSCHVDS